MSKFKNPTLTKSSASPTPRGRDISIAKWRYRIEFWTREEWDAATEHPEGAIPLDDDRGFLLMTPRE